MQEDIRKKHEGQLLDMDCRRNPKETKATTMSRTDEKRTSTKKRMEEKNKIEYEKLSRMEVEKTDIKEVVNAKSFSW